MEIKGEVAEIIYKNEVNGYCIAVFETEEESTTIVGYLPFVNKNDTLEVTGKFVEHQEYGRQFKVETFKKVMPETLDSLERYLANGLIKGIGPATAKKIVDTFGICRKLGIMAVSKLFRKIRSWTTECSRNI